MRKERIPGLIIRMLEGDPGLWHRGFFLFLLAADHCDTMNY